MKKLVSAVLATLIFFFFLFSTYWIHITYFEVNVILYSSIIDGLIASVGATILLFKIRRFYIFNTFEKLQMTIIWFISGYIFAISIPTVIDRSLSFYILEKIQQRGGGIQLEKFEEVFTKEYIKEHRLVDVRLTEQIESGTIKLVKGCVKLTDRGERFAKFSRFFRENFLPKKRLIMGKYTDDLTHPFDNDAINVNYHCN